MSEFEYSVPEKEKVEKDSTMDSEEPENLVFFYHPDHLGSTSMITNYDGEVTQNVAYIPYGEVFVEERNGNWASPFLFNAKELDEETGLYYYGARYLNPTDCRWLSTDPMFEKYVGMSPYNYCAGNPVKLVDPDGRDYIQKISSDGNLDIVYVDQHIKGWNKGDIMEVEITKDGSTTMITYLGKTYQDDKYYYSLFGKKLNLKDSNTEIYKSIDDAIINYGMSNMSIRNGNKERLSKQTQMISKELQVSFLSCKSNVEKIEYEGANGKYTFYNNSEAAKGRVTHFPDIKTIEGDYQGNEEVGFFLKIKNFSGSQGGLDIVNLKFEKEQRASFLNKYKKLFPNGQPIRFK